MSAAAEVQGTHLPRVAFQGEAGAFSEEALLLHFDGAAHSLPRWDFHGVGDAVRSGEAEYGILPVENTLAGSVPGANDVLAAGELAVVAEVILPIRHFLLGVPGALPDEVRRILSHPIALAQCTRALRARPRVEAVAVHDTAGAAAEVARVGDPALAAIAPHRAAALYGLEILESDLQDRDDNCTRFYIVRKGGGDEWASISPVRGASRTIILCELENRPGALAEILTPLAAAGIGLSRIESRPTSAPWRYRFLLELRAHVSAPEMRRALASAQIRALRWSVLGSIPAGEEPRKPEEE